MYTEYTNVSDFTAPDPKTLPGMLDLRLKDMFNEGKMIVSGASLKIFGVTTHKKWLTMVLRNQAI